MCIKHILKVSKKIIHMTPFGNKITSIYKRMVQSRGNTLIPEGGTKHNQYYHPLG